MHIHIKISIFVGNACPACRFCRQLSSARPPQNLPCKMCFTVLCMYTYIPINHLHIYHIHMYVDSNEFKIL